LKPQDTFNVTWVRWSLDIPHSTLYLTALIPPKMAIITKSRNVLKKSKVLHFKAEHAEIFFRTIIMLICLNFFINFVIFLG